MSSLESSRGPKPVSAIPEHPELVLNLKPDMYISLPRCPLAPNSQSWAFCFLAPTPRAFVSSPLPWRRLAFEPSPSPSALKGLSIYTSPWPCASVHSVRAGAEGRLLCLLLGLLPLSLPLPLALLELRSSGDPRR